MSEKWRIVAMPHELPKPVLRGLSEEEMRLIWIEAELYESYEAADQARLMLMQKYPRVDFFVERVPNKRSAA